MDVIENRQQWLTSFQEGFVAHYERTGEIDWDLYQYPKNRAAPSGKGVDLSASRLMLVSTAGAYLKGRQSAFDIENQLGDYQIHLIPTSVTLGDIAYSHKHYDHAAVEQDPQVLIPLRHLDNLVTEGVIGELVPAWVSYMGYQPDITRVVDDTALAILEAARNEQVQAVLLVPA
jgi:hypothetical protein